ARGDLRVTDRSGGKVTEVNPVRAGIVDLDVRDVDLAVGAGARDVDADRPPDERSVVDRQVVRSARHGRGQDDGGGEAIAQHEPVEIDVHVGGHDGDDRTAGSRTHEIVRD